MTAMLSEMREVQSIPTFMVLVSGLFYWLPGEIIGYILDKFFGRSQGNAQINALPVTTFFLVATGLMQLSAGHTDVSQSIFFLAGLTLFGNLIVSRLRRATGAMMRPYTKQHGAQEILNAAIYITFLFYVWWAPSGIKSIWEWPLQFEPSHLAVVLMILATITCLGGWKARLNPTITKLCAFISNILVQLAGIESKSLSAKEIIDSEKITGYFSASKRFNTISEMSEKFVSQIGGMPFHVNTHPAGKVALFNLTAQFHIQDPTLAWSVFILFTTALCPLLVHKSCRALGLSLERSALAALITAILPSFALFSPGFDIFNATLSTLLLLFWLKSLHAGSLPSRLCWSACAGAMGFICIIYAYNLLTFGAILIGLAFFSTTIQRRCSSQFVLITCLISTVTLAAILEIFFILTGYSVINSLHKSIALQAAIEGSNRQGLAATLLNGYDLLIGIGPYAFFTWASIVAPQAGWKSCASIQNKPSQVKRFLSELHPHRCELGTVIMASIAIISLSGKLNIETARVWIFLMPSIIISIASSRVIRPTEIMPRILFAQSLWGLMMISRFQFFF